MSSKKGSMKENKEASSESGDITVDVSALDSPNEALSGDIDNIFDDDPLDSGGRHDGSLEDDHFLNQASESSDDRGRISNQNHVNSNTSFSAAPKPSAINANLRGSNVSDRDCNNWQDENKDRPLRKQLIADM